MRLLDLSYQTSLSVLAYENHLAILLSMSVSNDAAPDERKAEQARLLRTAVARLQRRLRSERSTMNLGLSAYSALACVYQNGPLSAGQLSAHERLQPQSLTRILAALEERKLIARAADQADLRRTRITITRLGIDVLRQNARRQDAWLVKAIAQTLTPTEQEFLKIAAQLLDRISAAQV
jgi:DNA-binding MarR family transcriptional regulator